MVATTIEKKNTSFYTTTECANNTYHYTQTAGQYVDPQQNDEVNVEIMDSLETEKKMKHSNVSSSSYLSALLLLLVLSVTMWSYPQPRDVSLRSIKYIWWCGWLTAVATGLGAVPFFWIKHIDKFWLGICNALAAGMMLAATCCLFYEAMIVKQKDTVAIPVYMRVVTGAVIGVLFIQLTKKILEGHEDVKVGDLQGIDARKALLIMAVMTLHSISEGIGVGVSFGGDGGHHRGLCVSLTLAIHNIPEGLAISLVLIPRGLKVVPAILWCIFSSLPQPLFAVPAFLFVEKFLTILPVGLGFAGGAMAFVAILELVPESLEDTKSKSATVAGITVSFICMLNVQYILTGQI